MADDKEQIPVTDAECPLKAKLLAKLLRKAIKNDAHCVDSNGPSHLALDADQEQVDGN